MMINNEPAISLRDLSFRWSPAEPPVLQIPLLDIVRGERLFLYGPSGSGKTTLLNLLAGVLKPQGGELRLLGQVLNRFSQRQRDAFRARHIGVIFQQFNLIPYLNVLDNVLLSAQFARLPLAESRQRAEHLLDALGLSITLLDQPARQLSVGQQQRVAVARALVTRPEILIADEPTSALDSDSRAAFMQVLLDTAAEINCTIVFVSHDRSLQPFFSRVLDIRELGNTSHVEASC